MVLLVWLLRNFFKKRLNSGQTLFWLVLLLGAEVLTLFPSLVENISILWGNLVPVSWITFSGLSLLIVYLLYQTVTINTMQSRLVDLVRTIAFLEERLRKAEANVHED